MEQTQQYCQVLTLPTSTLHNRTSSTRREIVLSEIMDPVNGQPLEALLDGLPFTASAPPNPPLFVEANGATNVWQFINTTGDAHPMHHIS
jgi:hypothetical protein